MAKFTGPERKTIAEVAQEEGVSTATLYNWRKQARAAGRLLPDHDDTPEGWSGLDKFNAILETASLSESQIAEYCRRNALHPEQLARWRQTCAMANDGAAHEQAERQRRRREDRERIRRLEADLRRKEKALAEAAALLVLRKKVEAIWGEEDA